MIGYLIDYFYYCLINLAFCTGRSYTDFLPIKQVITNDQRFMGLLLISYAFKKPVLSYTFTFFPTCSVFGAISFPSPLAHLPLFFFFIKSPQPCLHRSYLQSKTFLITRAVPSSAAFCSNAVLIATPSSSMHFFSFFDVLPSAPTTTGMTLMLLM